MKILILAIMFLCFCCNSFAQEENSKTVPEKFRFDLLSVTQGSGRYGYFVSDDGWVISLNFSKSGGSQEEYAPAKDFYVVIKKFHPNGMILSRGKLFCGIKFGIWEFFDENGNLMHTVDEDRKFGKIKPADIVNILEKEKVINCEEGTFEGSWVLEGNSWVMRKYGTTGEFYKEVSRTLHMVLRPKEVYWKIISEPLRWEISFRKGFYMQYTFIVNGNTGKYKKYTQALEVIV